MKKGEGYEYKANEELTSFSFTSVGDKGEIEKKVTITHYQGNWWNLAFGDAESDDNFSDTAVSDNNDMRKVLQTITNIAHAFCHKYPTREIYIEPVDNPRKLLYNRIFQLKEEEILFFFHVRAILFKERFLGKYRPGRLYDAFVLTPRKSIFGK